VLLTNSATVAKLCNGNTYLSLLNQLGVVSVLSFSLHSSTQERHFFLSMANSVREDLRIPLLEHEVARLRQNVAELEARLRKPTLQQHLQELIKDYPNLSVVEQRQLAGKYIYLNSCVCSHKSTNITIATIIFVLRKKLGAEFIHPNFEDVNIIMTDTTMSAITRDIVYASLSRARSSFAENRVGIEMQLCRVYNR
jgi:hypothetical protein